MDNGGRTSRRSISTVLCLLHLYYTSWQSGWPNVVDRQVVYVRGMYIAKVQLAM